MLWCWPPYRWPPRVRLSVKSSTESQQNSNVCLSLCCVLSPQLMVCEFFIVIESIIYLPIDFSFVPKPPPLEFSPHALGILKHFIVVYKAGYTCLYYSMFLPNMFGGITWRSKVGSPQQQQLESIVEIFNVLANINCYDVTLVSWIIRSFVASLLTAPVPSPPD